jgi:hypothetical protein
MLSHLRTIKPTGPEGFGLAVDLKGYGRSNRVGPRLM